MSRVWGRVKCTVGRFSADGAGKEEIECSSDAFTIGRAKTCDLRITTSKCVSSRHCVLHYNSQTSNVTLEDVSTNGTLLNGTKMVKNTPAPIRTGDVVAMVQKREDPSQNLSFQYAFVDDEDSDETQDFSIDGDGDVLCDAGPAASADTADMSRKRKSENDDSELPEAKRPNAPSVFDDSEPAAGPTAAASIPPRPVDSAAASASEAVADAAGSASACGNAPSTAAAAAATSTPADNAATQAMTESLTCGICQDILHDCVSLQPCMHAFCAGCYCPWMAKSHRCPSCRKYVHAVSKNHIVNNLVEAFLTQHPERQRDADDIADLNGKNTLKSDTLTVSKRRRGRHHDDDDDDDDGSEGDYDPSDEGDDDFDDEDDDYDDDADDGVGVPFHGNNLAFGGKAFTWGAQYGFGQPAAFMPAVAAPQSTCRQCPGYRGRYKLRKPSADGDGGATVLATAVAPAPPALAAHNVAAVGFGRPPPADWPPTDMPAAVVSHECTAFTRHLLCHCCHEPMPDRRQDAQKPPTQECSLCKSFFCHQYWTCFGRDCTGCLQSFRDATFQEATLAQLVNKNIVETKVLFDHLKSENVSTAELFTACVKKLEEGKYSTPDSDSGQLKVDTVVCGRCALRNFAELAYFYRRDIPQVSLPERVRNRPNCHWGRECRTQWNKQHHAERFNHACVRTRFD